MLSSHAAQLRRLRAVATLTQTFDHSMDNGASFFNNLWPCATSACYLCPILSKSLAIYQPYQLALLIGLCEPGVIDSREMSKFPRVWNEIKYNRCCFELHLRLICLVGKETVKYVALEIHRGSNRQTTSENSDVANSYLANTGRWLVLLSVTRD